MSLKVLGISTYVIYNLSHNLVKSDNDSGYIYQKPPPIILLHIHNQLFVRFFFCNWFFGMFSLSEFFYLAGAPEVGVYDDQDAVTIIHRKRDS